MESVGAVEEVVKAVGTGRTRCRAGMAPSKYSRFRVSSPRSDQSLRGKRDEVGEKDEGTRGVTVMTDERTRML